MGKGLVERSTLTAIADAIREKTGSTAKMLPADMAGMIAAMSDGFNLMEGTVTLDGYVITEMPLGVVLPASDNYALIVAHNSAATFSKTSTYFVLGGAVLHAANNETAYFVSVSDFGTAVVPSAQAQCTLQAGNSEAILKINNQSSFEWHAGRYKWWYLYV